MFDERLSPASGIASEENEERHKGAGQDMGHAKLVSVEGRGQDDRTE